MNIAYILQQLNYCHDYWSLVITQFILIIYFIWYFFLFKWWNDYETPAPYFWSHSCMYALSSSDARLVAIFATNMKDYTRQSFYMFGDFYLKTWCYLIVSRSSRKIRFNLPINLEVQYPGWNPLRVNFKYIFSRLKKFIKTLMKMAEQRPNWCQLSQTLLPHR